MILLKTSILFKFAFLKESLSGSHVTFMEKSDIGGMCGIGIMYA